MAKKMMQGLVVVLVAIVAVAIGFPNRYFEGCRELAPDADAPACVYVPAGWLESETYRRFAHMAVGNYSHHNGDYYNTVLNVTRAANQILNGIVTTVEFTTVPSSCKVTETPVYTKKLCRPSNYKANGLCQAKFNVMPAIRLLSVACKTHP